MKGERGIEGMKGRIGDKGDKGESAKGTQASAVPQTNWEQCVWKSDSDTDNGKIRVNRIRIIIRRRIRLSKANSYNSIKILYRYVGMLVLYSSSLYCYAALL